MFKRVLLKISGEALSCSDSVFDRKFINKAAAQVIRLMDRGIQVAIVVGGGNFWRGRSSAPDMKRALSDQVGMLATVMNAMYISDVFESLGIHAVIQSPFHIGTMTEAFSRYSAIEHVKNGSVVIFAGGTGHPFFSTDTACALRGAEIDADILLFAKNGVDGAYDSDPKYNANAKRFDKLTFDEIIEKDLKVIDRTCAALCNEQNINIIIFGMDKPENIYKAACGESIGTLVTTN